VLDTRTTAHRIGMQAKFLTSASRAGDKRKWSHYVPCRYVSISTRRTAASPSARRAVISAHAAARSRGAFPVSHPPNLIYYVYEDLQAWEKI